MVDAAGLAEIAEARLETDATSITYEGLVSRRTVEGGFEARVDDLSALPGLHPWLTAGSAELTGEIAAAPYADTGRVRLDGGIAGFESGVEALAALAGDAVRVAGAMSALARGVEADDLQLEGTDIAIVLDGVAGLDGADLTLEAHVPRLSPLNERIGAGEASLTARLTGPSEGRSLAGELAVRDLVALEQPVPELTLGVEIDDLAAGFEARVALSGTVAGAPARGGARLLERETGYALEGLDVEIGSVWLQGDVFVGEALLSV